jgi:uncharacterized protein (TIRG00374 family)
MPPPTSARRFPWHTVVIAVLTAVLLWMFFRNVNLREAWQAAVHADFVLLAIAVGVTFVTYSLRAQRWRILLSPLGPVRFRTAFRTTLVGFTALFLLPGRVGEILRPYLLAKQEGLNPASAFATVVVERLLDVTAVLLLFAVAIPLVGIEIGPEVRFAGIVSAIGAVVALAVLSLLAGHPERLGKLAGRLGSRLPERFRVAFARMVQTFAEGLIVMRNPGHLAAAGLWSIAVWVSIGVGIWIEIAAFNMDVSFAGSFIVVGYLAVGVSVPTPGGAGGFHYFYKAALTNFFGANPDVAAAAAIVLHLISFVPVSIAGMVVMWQDGLTLGRLQSMKSEAQAAEQPTEPSQP